MFNIFEFWNAFLEPEKNPYKERVPMTSEKYTYSIETRVIKTEENIETLKILIGQIRILIESNNEKLSKEIDNNRTYTHSVSELYKRYLELDVPKIKKIHEELESVCQILASNQNNIKIYANRLRKVENRLKEMDSMSMGNDAGGESHTLETHTLPNHHVIDQPKETFKSKKYKPKEFPKKIESKDDKIARPRGRPRKVK